MVLGAVIQPIHSMLQAFKKPTVTDCKRHIYAQALANEIIKINALAKELEERLYSTPSYKAADFDRQISTMRRMPRSGLAYDFLTIYKRIPSLFGYTDYRIRTLESVMIDLQQKMKRAPA